MSGADEQITMTRDELRTHTLVAVQKEKLDILISDFQDRKKTDDLRYESLDSKLAEIYKLMRNFPTAVTQCRDALEKDIRDSYMSKEAAKALEDRVDKDNKSLKVWIVSSVGGFAAAGIVALWLMNMHIIIPR